MPTKLLRSIGGAAIALTGCSTAPEPTSTAVAEVIPNNCADPLWANTLRCQVYATPFTTAGGPATVADIRTFTRVLLLGDPSVRCLDGTAPIMYVDKAVDASGPIESNKWVFTVTGGGSCYPTDSDGDGVLDDASQCAAKYIGGEAGEMGTGDSSPMKNLFGIHSDDPTENPVFAGYNRVRINKCGYDRYMGRTSWTGLQADLDGDGVMETFDVYQQGYLHMLAAFDALLTGLTYTTWQDGGGVVLAAQETLPALSNAETILVVGHSGGAHGLMHNIDHVATDLAARGITADVRAVIDANFTLSQENEAAFTGAGDLYDHVWTGSTSGGGDAFNYDGAIWMAGGAYYDQTTAYLAELDASCLAAHAATGDDWQCRDKIHVLMNHVTTPFLMREDYSDRNHSNAAEGHQVIWGPIDTYTHCTGVSPCPAEFTVPAEHRPRLDEQADRLWFDHEARSELALGIDTSPEGVPTIAIWMPDCGDHAGAYDDGEFFVTTVSHAVGVRTMRSLLESFMTLPRTGRQSMYRDGVVDAGGFVSASTCAP